MDYIVVIVVSVVIGCALLFMGYVAGYNQGYEDIEKGLSFSHHVADPDPDKLHEC